MHRTLRTGALLLLASGCGGDERGGAGAPGTLTGTVVDGDDAPIPGALVSIEEGGIYLDNPDTSRGNPAYVFGAQADGEGVFTVDLPGGDFGLHVFADGYRYAPKRVHVDGATSVRIQAEANLPLDNRPVVSGASVEPSTAAPGADVLLTVTAAAADAERDPLSEETLAVEPTGAWTGVLDPPSPGIQGERFPDGEYSRTIAAPQEPGTYTYFFVTTTEACVTSDRIEVNLTVE